MSVRGSCNRSSGTTPSPATRASASTGPDVMLSPLAAQYLGMALHELSTNAAKYGSLSGAGRQGGDQLARRGSARAAGASICRGARTAGRAVERRPADRLRQPGDRAHGRRSAARPGDAGVSAPRACAGPSTPMLVATLKEPRHPVRAQPPPAKKRPGPGRDDSGGLGASSELDGPREYRSAQCARPRSSMANSGFRQRPDRARRRLKLRSDGRIIAGS